ncbi:hypothetical protein H109_06674, partial [Trichophyton interdigitale MR816]
TDFKREVALSHGVSQAPVASRSARNISTTLNMMGILFILWAEPAWPLRDKCLTVNAESSAEMVCVSECQRINGDSRTLLAPFRQMQCYSDLGSYTHSYTPPPGSPPSSIQRCGGIL